MREVLIRPLVTEKSTAQSEKLNRYGFVVAITANKIEIKDAVEKMYGVKVKDVNTAIRPNKFKQRYVKKGGMTRGMKGRMKKAYVTLATGETIDFYSTV